MRTMTLLATVSVFLVSAAGAGEPGVQKPADAGAKVEPATAGKVAPELAPEAELLARIAALAEDTWMKLPPVKTAGDLSWCGKPEYRHGAAMAKTGPGGRDFCNKMVWAPERKRALYCGANHAVPHRYNDVWEYDLAANTWVCLFAPDIERPKSPGCHPLNDEEVAWVKTNVVLKEGVPRTRRGGPAKPCHTWWGLCYDSDRRRLLWLEPWLVDGAADNPSLAKGLGLDPAELKAQMKPGPYLWSFDPAAREWSVACGNLPPTNQGDSMEYIPDLKQVWIPGSRGGRPWLHDPEKGTSRDLKATGPVPGGERVTAYDPATRTMVAVLESNTWSYSFQRNEWQLLHENTIAYAMDNRSLFCHDRVAGRFVLFGFAKDSQPPPHLWLYDPAAGRWEAREGRGDVPKKKETIAGYYDPERNVTVYCNGGAVWVYRCKKAGA